MGDRAIRGVSAGKPSTFVLRWYRHYEQANLSQTFEELSTSIATELDVAPTHVQRLITGYLATFLSFILSKSLTATSPAVVSFVEKMKSMGAVQIVTQILRDVMGPRLGQTAEPNGDAVDQVVKYINEKLEPRLDEIETKVGINEPSFALICEEITKLTDSIVKQMDAVEDRIDEVEAKAERVNPLKKSPEQRAAEKPAKLQHRRKRERVWRDKRTADRQMKERIAAAASPLHVEFEEDPKPQRGRPKGSTMNAGAKPPKRGRGRPKGSKTQKNTVPASRGE